MKYYTVPAFEDNKLSSDNILISKLNFIPPAAGGGW